MAEKNYYDILGLDKNCSQEDINKKFKKLALQYHPDRWVGKPEKEQKEAEEKFKEINVAYQTLSDPDKRAQSDNPNPFGGANGFNPFAGFNPFGDDPFGGFNPFGRGNVRQEHINVGSDIHTTINVTLSDAYNGGKKKITIEKQVHCSDCNGTGSADGEETTCPHCHGTGMISKKTVEGYMTSIISSPCPHCHGTGKIIKNPCKSCNGTGLKIKTVTQEIEIPKGVFDGVQIVYEGLGNEPKGKGKNGDLIIQYKVENNDYFKVKGIDIIHEENIKFNEAMLGCEREISFMDGTKQKLTIPEGTKDNTQFTYKNKGMFNLQTRDGYGNYIVVVKYVYPNKLSDEQKKILEGFKW